MSNIRLMQNTVQNFNVTLKTQGFEMLVTSIRDALVSGNAHDTTLVQLLCMYVFRTLDGSGNNLRMPTYGMINTVFRRVCSPMYDITTQMAVRGASNPSPRVISNSICQGVSRNNTEGLSDMIWVWGQFLDHDIVLTNSGDEKADIVTPTDTNEVFPGRTIPFTRSKHIVVDGVRKQQNETSSYIDGTTVYGSTIERAYALRRLDGTGKLKTGFSDNGEIMLPYNVENLDNAVPTGRTASEFYLAGDVRANENVLLSSIHVLFVREHNRLCDIIALEYPSIAGKDEMIYQHSRRLVIGMIQHITFEEFLPALLGESLQEHSGYLDSVDASLATEFSTVAFRFGHTMLSSKLRVGEAGNLLLKDAFFSPSYLQANGGDALLYGATKSAMQEIDGILVEDVRSFLFEAPTVSVLHDLAALNIQRGRDHGICGYNDMREAYGLQTIASFEQLPMPDNVRKKLELLYDSVNDIDPWVGVIVETHIPGKPVGPLLYTMLKEQFLRLRQGDRLWYKNDQAINAEDRAIIEKSTLSKVLERNTSFSGYAENVFRL